MSFSRKEFIAALKSYWQAPSGETRRRLAVVYYVGGDFVPRNHSLAVKLLQEAEKESPKSFREDAEANRILGLHFFVSRDFKSADRYFSRCKMSALTLHILFVLFLKFREARRFEASMAYADAFCKKSVYLNDDFDTQNGVSSRVVRETIKNLVIGDTLKVADGKKEKSEKLDWQKGFLKLALKRFIEGSLLSHENALKMVDFVCKKERLDDNEMSMCKKMYLSGCSILSEKDRKRIANVLVNELYQRRQVGEAIEWADIARLSNWQERLKGRKESWTEKIGRMLISLFKPMIKAWRRRKWLKR
jgi:hypothetical protein